VCCGSCLWQLAEEEEQRRRRAGFVLEDAVPDELTEESGTRRVATRDPLGFSFAFKAGERLLKRIFGRKLAAARD
jgi:hypothetical protein